MGDHYIPQYYLKGFSDSPDSSNIWVYEKGSTKIFPSSIKRAANENNRWPENVEEHLANKIEAPANPVFDKIRNFQPITQNDKELLATYIVVMLQRVPKGLERAKAIAPEVIGKTFDNTEKQILRLIEEHPSKKDALQRHLEFLPKIKSEWENDFPIEVWHQLITSDDLTPSIKILPAMTWVFFTSEKSQPFLTNDNPVFFHESIGVGNPESELTFPISSNITLWATWKGDIKEGCGLLS